MEKVIVRVRGVIYESMAEAGRAFNRSPNVVRNLLEKGRLDNLGLGKNQRVRITINNKTYSSIQQAHRELGISFNALRTWRAKNILEEKVSQRLQKREAILASSPLPPDASARKKQMQRDF